MSVLSSVSFASWRAGWSRLPSGFWPLVLAVALSGVLIDGAILLIGIARLQIPDVIATVILVLQVALWALPAFALAQRTTALQAIGASVLATMLQVLTLTEIGIVAGLLAGHPQSALQAALLFMWLGFGGGVAAVLGGLFAGVAIGSAGWLSGRILSLSGIARRKGRGLRN